MDYKSVFSLPLKCQPILSIAAFISVFSFVSPQALAEAIDQHTITTDDLLAIRGISTMIVSPDGGYVAYQLQQADADQNNYNISWHVAELKPDSKSITVANDLKPTFSKNSGGGINGEIFAGEAIWSPDGQWIVYSAAQNGEIQLWRSRFDREGREQLTYNPADVEGPRFFEGGTTLLFATGRDRATVKTINQSRAAQGYLAQEPPIYDVTSGPRLPPCSDNSERWNIVQNDDLACKLRIWSVDIETGTERPATPAEIDYYYAKPDTSLSANIRRGFLKGGNRRLEVLSPNGKHTAWFENEAPGSFQGPLPPMRITVSLGGKIYRCPMEECKTVRPEKLWWAADGRELLILVRNGPNNTLSSLYGWTPGSDNIRTIFSNDDMFYDCNLNKARLICGHESWSSPRKIVSVDLADGEIATIVDPNPEFQNFRFTKIEKILGTDSFGNKAHGHLVYPQGYEEGTRYPLVIVQYISRGFLRGGVGDEHPIHVLAQHGFFVLSFNTPDGDYLQREGDQLALQIAYLKYTMVDRGPAIAIERMVDELDDRGFIDPNKVGITGISHGATTTDSAILCRDYAAASTGYSLSAPPNFDFSSDSNWGKSMNGVFGGAPYSKKGFETRSRNSVGVNASSISTPYLINVADREYEVTRQNYNALRDASKAIEMHIFPDEFHVKWQPVHRLTVYNRNLDWFDFWLRGVEDENSIKAPQYDRWRLLREKHHRQLNSNPPRSPVCQN